MYRGLYDIRPDSLSPTIIKQTRPLYRLPSSPHPIKSPQKYSLHFRRYMLSNNKQTSSDIFRSFFKIWAHFTASIVPLQFFFNNGINGKGKSFYKILYDCTEVYRISNGNRITLAEYTGISLNLYSQSFSNMLSNFLVCDSK